jgi:hypothetical protein
MEATNIIQQNEYDWKKDIETVKKDRTKDLYPSIKWTIENAFATERDKLGKLGEKFIILFNSKTHAAATSNSTNILRMSEWETSHLPKEFP